MKKLFSIFVLVATVAATTFFTSCSEDNDNTVPDITLGGQANMDIVINSVGNWVEPGFTATDNKDGDITSKVVITGTVDVTKLGTYVITYRVEDEAGNYIVVERTVNVIVNNQTYVASYAVVDVITGPGSGTYNYTVTASISSIDTGKILLANFGGYGNTQIAYFTFTKEGVISIPSQHVTGSPGFEGTLQGTGTTADNGNVLNITYSYTYDDGSGTDNGTATYTKR
ncbi:MAG: DUF5011 domain-containing protein [Lentimicrobiaceae bacterium]|jgi:hypothetical protein|nr:DUF5011 domain-containing protein [Lentimicrobiaceae bacterium]